MSELKIQVLSDPSDLKFIEEFSSFKDEVRDSKYLIGKSSVEQTKMLLLWGLSQGAKFILVRDKNDEVILRMASRKLPHVDNMGAIGFFETNLIHPEHQDAFELAINDAEEFFKTQGVKNIIAPVDLSTWFNYRFALYDKKAWPRFGWEPTTPPEYEALFRKKDYKDYVYYHSVFFPHIRIGNYHFGQGPLNKSYKNVFKQGFKLEPFNFNEIQKDLPTLHEIVHDAFTGGFLFEPIDVKTFSLLYASALQHYDFSPSAKLISPTGEVAGFIFAFYDGDYLIVKSLAIKKKFQGLNLSSGLIYHCCKQSFPRKVKGTISALVKSGIASESIERNVTKTNWFTWSHKYILLNKEL